MDKSKKQSILPSRRPMIVISIDILLTIILFHNFSQWGTYQTLPAKLMGIFICIYIMNDWMTTRSSFDLYSPHLLIADMVVIFIFANIPHLLKEPHQMWGYSPFFWFAVGLVEFLYAFWDIVVKRVAPSEKVQKNLTFWAYLSFLSTVLCWGVFFYQMACEKNWNHLQQWIGGDFVFYGHIASAIPVIYLLSLTIKWNWDRYQASKKEGSSFFA